MHLYAMLLYSIFKLALVLITDLEDAFPASLFCFHAKLGSGILGLARLRQLDPLSRAHLTGFLKVPERHKLMTIDLI